jgi:hypothetical protein
MYFSFFTNSILKKLQLKNSWTTMTVDVGVGPQKLDKVLNQLSGMDSGGKETSYPVDFMKKWLEEPWPLIYSRYANIHNNIK